MRKTIIALALALVLALSVAASAENLGQVAGTEDMTDVEDIVDPNMVPVTADSLNEGTYAVNVDVSSSMFKVTACEITVADGAITAALHMKSDAYLFLYPGTAEEAAAANYEDLLELQTADGDYWFSVPVAALDAGLDVAAFSARKQMWYPRTMVFRSDSLPTEAWRADLLVTPESLGLTDGDYTAEVTLEGGRATLESPAALHMEGGVLWADLVFSTKKIDYVIVDGEKYLPTNTEGNAAFTVPVASFDNKLSIIVDSTAIKPATEVPYTMTFASESLAAAQ